MNHKSKTIYKIVAENIKYYREEKGMTISDLAQKTGYTKDFITKLEAALYTKKCTITVVYNIAIALEINTDLLLMDTKKVNSKSV